MTACNIVSFVKPHSHYIGDSQPHGSYFGSHTGMRHNWRLLIPTFREVMECGNNEFMFHE